MVRVPAGPGVTRLRYETVQKARFRRPLPLVAAMIAVGLVSGAGTVSVVVPVKPGPTAISPSSDGRLGATGQRASRGPQAGKDVRSTPGSTVLVAAYAPELAADGIPVVALTAYRRAEARMAEVTPSCHLPWYLVAGIGRVESDHGQFGGAHLLQDGTSAPPIIGLALDGRGGVALIPDTDHGRYDGDPIYDHAVGPMQFIPSTWVRYAADGNGDGTADPFNINDAALAAAFYLCNAGGDLSTEAGRTAAVHSYNHSEDYVALVLAIATEYQRGVRTLPTPAAGTGTLPTRRTGPLPPVSVGPPPAAQPDLSAAPTPTLTPTAAPTTAPATTPTTTPTPTTTTPACPPTSTPTPTPTESPTPGGTTTPSSSPASTPQPTPPPSDSSTPTPTPSSTCGP